MDIEKLLGGFANVAAILTALVAVLAYSAFFGSGVRSACVWRAICANRNYSSALASIHYSTPGCHSRNV